MTRQRTPHGHPTAARRLKADKLLQAWLIKAGATVGTRGVKAMPELNWPIDCPEYILETALGKLTVYPASTQGSGYTCFTRFAEPERAAQVIGTLNMNGYSGKWNFHHFDGHTCPEDFVAWVTGDIHDYCLPTVAPLEPKNPLICCGRDLVIDRVLEVRTEGCKRA